MRVPQTTSPALPVPYMPGPAAAPPISGFQMTGADIRRVLRANAWLIILFLIVSGIGGYALNMWLSKNHPRYTAIGLLQVNPSVTVDFMTDKTSDMGELRLVSELRTQAQLLTTERLFSAVLQKEGPLRESKWFAQFRGPDGIPITKAAKEDLAKILKVMPIPDSTLLSITCISAEPKDCKTIIDEVVTEHLDQQKEQAELRFSAQTKSLRDMNEALGRQLDNTSKRLYEKQIELAKKGVSGPLGFSSRDVELKAFLEQKLKLAAMASELKTMYAVAASKAEKGTALGMVETQIENDPTVSSYTREISSLEMQKDLTESTQGDKRQDVLRLKNYLDLANQKLDSRRELLRVRMRAAYIDELRFRAEQADTELKSVSDEVEKLKNERADLGKELNYLENYKEEEKSLREQQLQVSTKLRDLNVARSPATLSRIDWASKPEIPEIQTFPRLSIILPLSMMLGLMMALGIAFLRELMDDTVRSPRDVARVGQMNLLGIIAEEGDDPQAASAKIAIFDAPHSLTAEQFRQVRARLQHATSLDTTRTILVTGPSPLDGKTTVASNIAAALALSGRKILLVDANFRRPEIHRLFNFSNDKGLSDVLNASCPFEEASRTTRVPNLSVMTSGPKPLNATELFESQLMTDFIEHALEEFDHVIFDSGPFLVVSESVALASRVDGVVTVVRAHSESRGLLQRMRDSLRQVKAEHIGVILNAVRAQGGGYYRRSIKTFYDYQSEE
jgi:capsular exopolysaccharide synthesis family protein